MYFITTKRMLEVCFFQHTPTFIIEPKIRSVIFIVHTFRYTVNWRWYDECGTAFTGR